MQDAGLDQRNELRKVTAECYRKQQIISSLSKELHQTFSQGVHMSTRDPEFRKDDDGDAWFISTKRAPYIFGHVNGESL